MNHDFPATLEAPFLMQARGKKEVYRSRTLVGSMCKLRRIYILVGGLEHFLFFHILGIMIPTD